MHFFLRAWALLAFLTLASFVNARTWTSADGAKTFEGELVSYDPKTEMVGVKVARGTIQNFSQIKLSAADIAFLKEKGKFKANFSPVSNDPKENLHIYLLIGQSNMAGRAPLLEDQKEEIGRCLLLNEENVFEPAKNPLNRYSTISKGLGMQKLGPGYAFAQEMLKESRSHITLGLVVNARGGSRIGQWEIGDKYYDHAITRTKEALKTGTLKGIIWHQGESDAKNPEQYLVNLTALVKNLRAEFGLPDLPFVAGQVNKVPAINAHIANLPAAVEHTAYVSNEGLKAFDRWHFDNESTLELGRRYAAEMLKLQGK